MTASHTPARFRVRGPLSISQVAQHGTYIRTSFDHRSRAVLEADQHTIDVWHEAFKKAPWEWRETPRIRRCFATSEATAAVAYFNSLALSPGYMGPVAVEPISADAAPPA